VMRLLISGDGGRLVLLVTWALLLSACSQVPPQPEPTPDEAAPVNQSAPDTATAESMRDHALRDLSRRLNLPASDIQVLALEAVTWSDGALGCPQPGFAYTQALVPGFRVVLAVDDVEYHYHGGDRGRPFLCPEDRRGAPLEIRHDA